eukprot:2785632-Rhodomonas_salina.1
MLTCGVLLAGLDAAGHLLGGAACRRQPGVRPPPWIRQEPSQSAMRSRECPPRYASADSGLGWAQASMNGSMRVVSGPQRIQADREA